MKELELLRDYYHRLYGKENPNLLNEFIRFLEQKKNTLTLPPMPERWYKDAVIYALYVDQFDTDFQGLTARLPYLSSLGVDCLWLLPILDSPMKDAGFDIRDYRSIRKNLFSLSENSEKEETQKRFRTFLEEAHRANIRVIFDIAMNHTSNEHPWFQESRKGVNNPYRDYYIWNQDTNLYKETRLLFKGLCPSNWEYDNGAYFFHRFYEFQPDLNYRNPKVLIEISSILADWLSEGVDGFRADAIPFIWKEDGTSCENLPEAHIIIKFFRTVLDYLRPGTLLMAEANQLPMDVVEYFAGGDECHAGYHFPLMPQIFISMATADRHPVMQVLSPEITPPIPSGCQWITFLRLHDELTLEMVTPKEREIMNRHYRHDPRWNFREGEGISSRLSELFQFNPSKTLQALSIMLTLPGTPILYYGDEFGQPNNEAWFEFMKSQTGYPDSRFYVRGPIDWEWAGRQISNPISYGGTVYRALMQMIKIRKQNPVFGHGTLSWPEIWLREIPASVLAFYRETEETKILVIHNLSSESVSIILPHGLSYRNLLDSQHDLILSGKICLAAFENLWLTEL